jgi:hypothetical protein
VRAELLRWRTPWSTLEARVRRVELSDLSVSENYPGKRLTDASGRHVLLSLGVHQLERRLKHCADSLGGIPSRG